jgi:hypothetical protein
MPIDTLPGQAILLPHPGDALTLASSYSYFVKLVGCDSGVGISCKPMQSIMVWGLESLGLCDHGITNPCGISTSNFSSSLHLGCNFGR